MGPRSIANMVFIVLLAAALVFGLVASAEFVQGAMAGPG
jgi:hypothetical protein